MKRRYNRPIRFNKETIDMLKVIAICILIIVGISNIPELMIK